MPGDRAPSGSVLKIWWAQARGGSIFPPAPILTGSSRTPGMNAQPRAAPNCARTVLVPREEDDEAGRRPRPGRPTWGDHAAGELLPRLPGRAAPRRRPVRQERRALAERRRGGWPAARLPDQLAEWLPDRRDARHDGADLGPASVEVCGRRVRAAPGLDGLAARREVRERTARQPDPAPRWLDPVPPAWAGRARPRWWRVQGHGLVRLGRDGPVRARLRERAGLRTVPALGAHGADRRR